MHDVDDRTVSGRRISDSSLVFLVLLMQTKNQKNSIRKEVRSKLDEFGFFDLVEKSGRLQLQFESFILDPGRLFLKEGFTVSFHPFGSEPQINLEEYSIPIAYVRIEYWEQRQVVAAVARRDLPDLWEEFQPTADIQIFQPKANCPKLKSDQISVILVPGIAFDRSGNRLGRGKGFYDQFLKDHPEALRVGIGFQEQIITEVPVDPWDQCLDIILTDQETIITQRFSDWKKCGKVKTR